MHLPDFQAMLDGAWSHPFDTDGDPSTLEADGKRFDLKDPQACAKAHVYLDKKRAALKAGHLSEYEDQPTRMGGGGRTRLLYDELRVQMAEDYHAGKHDMSWQEQSAEADRIRGIRAAELRKQGKL